LPFLSSPSFLFLPNKSTQLPCLRCGENQKEEEGCPYILINRDSERCIEGAREASERGERRKESTKNIAGGPPGDYFEEV
jgi:hypothetical protein